MCQWPDSVIMTLGFSMAVPPTISMPCAKSFKREPLLPIAYILKVPWTWGRQPSHERLRHFWKAILGSDADCSDHRAKGGTCPLPPERKVRYSVYAAWINDVATEILVVLIRGLKIYLRLCLLSAVVGQDNQECAPRNGARVNRIFATGWRNMGRLAWILLT